VGLDIGSSAVKVVELKELGKGKGYQLLNASLERLSPEAIVDGAIMDAGLVIDTIQKAFSSRKIKGSDVAIALSGHSVIIKKISIPATSEEELAEVIPWEAEQYIPFDVEDVNLAYQVLKGASGGEGNMDVLLVAAKKDKIQNHTSVISLAGRSPEVVDIDAFALQNAFEANYDVHPDAVIALLNIGASLMNINITKGGMPLFIRDVSVGGNQYTDILQKELQLNFQEAEDLKLGKTGGSEAEMVQPLLESITEMLVMEVQKTFDFFRETYPNETITRVLISGGTSHMLGLPEKVQETFRYPTEILNPFKSIAMGPKVDAAKATSLGPALAVAVGLALRGFDQ